MKEPQPCIDGRNVPETLTSGKTLHNNNTADNFELRNLGQLLLALTLTANQTSRQLMRTSPCQPGKGPAACEPAGKRSPEPDRMRMSSARGFGARDITPRLLSDCGSWSRTTAQLPAVQTDTRGRRRWIMMQCSGEADGGFVVLINSYQEALLAPAVGRWQDSPRKPHPQGPISVAQYLCS